MVYVLLLLEDKLVWNIPLLVTLLSVAIIYGCLIRRMTSIQFYHRQPLLFLLGLCLLYFTIGSPLSAFSHLSFTTHMIQMSILYFMVPPLLLLGIPTLPLSYIKKSYLVNKARKLFFRPIATLSTFAVLFFFYHFPLVLNLLAHAPLLHKSYTWLLFLLSFTMWGPLVTPTPMQNGYPEQKKRYALLSGLMLMPSCLLFILNSLVDGMSNPFFFQLTSVLCLPAHFNTFDLLPFSFNTRLDQFMGGVLMLGLHKFGLSLTFLLGEKTSVY